MIDTLLDTFFILAFLPPLGYLNALPYPPSWFNDSQILQAAQFCVITPERSRTPGTHPSQRAFLRETLELLRTQRVALRFPPKTNVSTLFLTLSDSNDRNMVFTYTTLTQPSREYHYFPRTKYEEPLSVPCDDSRPAFLHSQLLSTDPSSQITAGGRSSYNVVEYLTTVFPQWFHRVVALLGIRRVVLVFSPILWATAIFTPQVLNFSQPVPLEALLKLGRDSRVTLMLLYPLLKDIDVQLIFRTTHSPRNQAPLHFPLIRPYIERYNCLFRRLALQQPERIQLLDLEEVYEEICHYHNRPGESCVRSPPTTSLHRRNHLRRPDFIHWSPAFSGVVLNFIFDLYRQHYSLYNMTSGKSPPIPAATPPRCSRPP